MTTEHDRLLAEGPRSAAEPHSVDGFDSLSAATAAVTTEPPNRTGTSGPVVPRGGRFPARLGRLLVPIVLAIVLVAQSLGSHSIGSALFVAVWVAIVIAALARRRRRRS
jgi:MYXO-CTERM domain-containing protein